MNIDYQVTGLRAVTRALRQVDKALGKQLRDDLKKAAEPVAESARSKLARYRGASLGTVRPGATGAAVFVQQYARKVTGRRGDFGALQMRNAFIPALAEREPSVVRQIEDAIDSYVNSAGF